MPVDLSDAALHSSLHRTAKILGIKLPDSPGNHRDMVPFILEEAVKRLVDLEKIAHGPSKQHKDDKDGRTTKRR